MVRLNTEVKANGRLPAIKFKAVINTSQVIATVDEKFLSFGMSWDTVVGWNFAATIEKHKTALLKALSPSYVRIGGHTTNFFNFQFNEEEKTSPFGNKTVQITDKDLDRLNQIAKNAGWQVLFALSVLKRSAKDGSWDASNTFRIVKYAANKGYRFGWELGNGRWLSGPLKCCLRSLDVVF